MGPHSMRVLSGQQIREAFLEFYLAKGHRLLPSASLIPEDPTVLLTIAGMLPFKPIFLGQQQPPALRVTTSQKCVRTNDIENVGRTARHHTFFEMLGNFSFGDYFKKEAIIWAWELTTQVFHIPPERVVVSVFREDDEAYALWRDLIGVTPARIQRLDEKDNFWVSGPTGPCGPCSELYYDFHPELGDQGIDLEDDSRFIEFYNLVFMQYNRDLQGTLTPLQNQNIDTGLGLERMAQILQGVPNNYETDLVFPIIETCAQLADLDYHQSSDEQKRYFKVLGDHLRAVVHLIADGITPSNTGRGYVLRRLIRRAVRYGRLLGITGVFTAEVAQTVITLYQTAYPTVLEKQAWIQQVLRIEEDQFRRTLENGERLLTQILAAKPVQISGADAFRLYDTYGFPVELTAEIAEEQGIGVDEAGFTALLAEQKQRSKEAHQALDLTLPVELEGARTTFTGYHQTEAVGTVVGLLGGANGQDAHFVTVAQTGDNVQIILDQSPFYAESGGQLGDRGLLTSEHARIVIKDVQKKADIFFHEGYVETGSVQVADTLVAQIDLVQRRRVQAHHTATHLLNAALKLVVDPNIAQAGSLVAFDRLRFDFNCPRALTEKEINALEDLVNDWIAQSTPLETQVLPIAEAKAQGAVATFGEKYGAEVRVVDVPGASKELCGGTHVTNTSEIGLFKIISETGTAAGIRRIEAVAGGAVLDYLNLRDRITRQLSTDFKVTVEELPERVNKLQSDLRQLQKELDHTKADLALAQALALADQAILQDAYHLLSQALPPTDPESLKQAAEKLLHKLGEGAVVLGTTTPEGKVTLIVAYSPALVKQGHKAGDLIKALASVGAKGGGRPQLAQAGGIPAEQLATALALALEYLKKALS